LNRELSTGTSRRKRKTSQDRILAAASKHFAMHGYLGTSLKQVASDAGVTRGALYHHFKDKHDLFRRVCLKLQSDNAKKIDIAIAEGTNPWESFVNGIHAALDTSSGEKVRRILFVERVSVLTWDEWSAIDTATVGGSLRPVMSRAMDEGYMERRPVMALFYLLLGSISRVTTIAAESDEIDLKDMHEEFDQLLARYRLDRAQD
jgi:AcrR family transcriptional regulator